MVKRLFYVIPSQRGIPASAAKVTRRVDVVLIVRKLAPVP